MRVIQPIVITDAVLAATTIPEDDAPVWDAGTAYNIGARVRLAATHRIYESLIANNAGTNPAGTTGASAWLDVGPTNRWAMFDQAVGTLTKTDEHTLTVTLAPDGLFDALAVLETDAIKIRVDVMLNGNRRFTDTKTGTGPGADLSSVVFTGLPIARTSSYVVTLTSEAPISVGTVMLGSSLDLGTTESSPSIGITDYSRRETDDFGTTTIVPRGWAKRMTLKSMVPTSRIDAIQRQLAALRATPALWLGDEGYEALAVYGFYKDFQVDVAHEQFSYCSLTIEGLTDGGVTPKSTSTDPDTGGSTIAAGAHNRYFSVASLARQSGEQDDNGRWWRAVLAVSDPSSTSFGKRLALDENAGSWDGSAIPTVDPVTGGAVPPRFLRKKGAWIINSKASYAGATSHIDPRTGYALLGNLVSGLWVEGDPGRTIVCKGTPDVHNIFYVKPAKMGDRYDLDERFSVVRDITMKNLVTLDEVYRWGFFESMAAVRLCGVDGFTLEGLQGYGHRGDWLDIAMSDVGWEEILQSDGSILKKNTENYHNGNGTVRDCHIDGYNRNNRNPITLLDCDKLLVEAVTTTECCKEGGGGTVPLDPMNQKSGLQMPSSLLDGEPNIEVKNPILRDITVRGCRASDGGGDGVNLFVRANADIPTKQVGFTVESCEFVNIRSGLAVFAVENSADPYGIRYQGNTVRGCKRPFQILRGETVSIWDNLFEDCEHYADAGYEISPGVFLPMAHSEIARNTFRKCGSEGAGAMVIHGSDVLLVAENLFDRCSKAGYIHRGGGNNRYYTSRDNIFISAGEPDAVAIGVVTSNGLTPTFDLATCLEQDNVYNGLRNFGLMIPGSRLVPTDGGLFTPLGPWPQGATILGEQGAGGGEIVSARVAKAGRGTGMGNTGSGNDAPVWEVICGNGGLFPAPSATGSIGTYSRTKSTAMRQQGNRFTALTRTSGNFATGSSSYPAGPYSVFIVVPYRGIHGVAAGIARDTSNPQSDADLLACVQLLGDTAQVMKKGVLQNANGNWPNKVPIQAGMTIRVDYNELSGQADFFVMPEDGAAAIQFGRWNDTGSQDRRVVAIIRMTVAREFIDFFG